MNESINYILEAKRDWTWTLVDLLYRQIYHGFHGMWEECKRTAPPKMVYAEFQTRLQRVPIWNQDIVDSAYNHILKATQCDFMEELLREVFRVSTQAMVAPRAHQLDPTKKIKVKVPQGSKFVHCVYRECANSFHEQPWLLEDRPGIFSRIEQTKNLQKAYKIIQTCIENTIKRLLPVRSLLNQQLEEMEGEDATPPPFMYSQTPNFNRPMHDFRSPLSGGFQAPPSFNPQPDQKVIPIAPGDILGDLQQLTPQADLGLGDVTSARQLEVDTHRYEEDARRLAEDARRLDEDHKKRNHDEDKDRYEEHDDKPPSRQGSRPQSPLPSALSPKTLEPTLPEPDAHLAKGDNNIVDALFEKLSAPALDNDDAGVKTIYLSGDGRKKPSRKERDDVQDSRYRDPGSRGERDLDTLSSDGHQERPVESDEKWQHDKSQRDNTEITRPSSYDIRSEDSGSGDERLAQTYSLQDKGKKAIEPRHLDVLPAKSVWEPTFETHRSRDVPTKSPDGRPVPPLDKHNSRSQSSNRFFSDAED